MTRHLDEAFTIHHAAVEPETRGEVRLALEATATRFEVVLDDAA